MDSRKYSELENKKLTSTLLIATFLLPTFLFAMPTVAAVTPASVTVDLPSSSADFGQTLVATVNVANAPNLAGIDIRLRYNPLVFTALNACSDQQPDCLSGTLFDPAVHPVIISPRSGIIQSIGAVRMVVAYLGQITSGPSGGLVRISFKVNDPATSTASASDYPSTISLVKASIVVNNNGSVVACPQTCPLSTTDGTYMPPADVGLRNVGCRATNNGFNTHAKGLTDPLFCRVVNTGSQSITVRGDFNYQSLGGISGSVSGDSITLGPGAAGEVTSALTVQPGTNDIFLVTGMGTRLVTFSDGSVLAIPNTTPFDGTTGGSLVFAVTVISPF